MGMRRDARRHDTVAVRRQAVVSEDYAEYRQGDRVITIDGPGRVVAVHDGPFPGAEEYEIRLEGGLGGGTYDAGQITASAPVEASVGQSEAAGIHLASDDYPELGTLLHDRPDPASLTYTASLEYQDGPDGGLSLTPAASVVDDDGEGQVMRDMSQYHSSPAGDWSLASRLAARAFDHYHPDQAMAARKTAVEHVAEHDPITDPDELADHMIRHHGWQHSLLPDDDDELRDDHEDEHKKYPVSLGHHHGNVWTDEHWCPVHEEYHDDTGDAADHIHNGSLTDWDLHEHEIPDEIHRGMNVQLPPEVHSIVHDESRPEHERARHLLHHLKGGMGIGMHWTTSDGQAEQFAEHGTAPEEMGFDRNNRTRVILHARTPDREHFETDPDKMDGVFHFMHEEKEIPLQRGVPLHLTGISWNDRPEFEYDHAAGTTTRNPYTHHNFTEPHKLPVQEPLFHATSSLPSVSAETGPADLARAMDKFHDDQQERHQDDAMYVPDWGPLHKSDIPADEHGPWMFMERKPAEVNHVETGYEHDGFGGGSPTYSPLGKEIYTYKHGITRTPLHLDAEGNAYHRAGPRWIPRDADPMHWYYSKHLPGHFGEGRSAKAYLEGRGHYNRLKDLGATPQTKYDTDYQLQRNKRLQDAGFDVISHKVLAHDEHENLGPSPTDPGRLYRHMVTDHGYTPDQIHGLGETGQGDELVMEHELEHDASTYDGGVGGGEFGRGEQGGGMSHVHREHEPEQRSGYAPFPDLPQSYHPAWGGSAAPDPAHRLLNSVPAQADTELPLHALSLLATAALDNDFRFHVTAAWRDVQAKAKRIRASGGVSIKHSDGMTVVADVKGDHNVYETALQRAPGRRQSVAVYACGCKWGAYHWGAADDLSRFAGRMCSHALALQYEAASRGMFGRDVEVDDTRPRWVPSKVVVKYDIDEGRHIRRSASVPEQPPLLVALASLDDGDPAAHVVTAAVNDLFGDTSGYTEPSLMDPAGPTAPWNPDESPASAGPLSGGEPHNWGSITGPQMLPRLAQALTAEAFWQAIVPLVRAVAPKVIEKAVTGHPSGSPPETVVPDGTENGAQALLHDEPEGALPETDGEEHTASLGDVDLVNEHSLWSVNPDALSPEDPSMQTQGTANQDAADVVAEFQRSAAAKSLMDGGPKDKSGSDIARAAQEYLAKTAASSFSRAEQDALIHESPGVQASNTDRLDIAGTHYAELEARDDEEDDALWLM